MSLLQTLTQIIKNQITHQFALTQEQLTGINLTLNDDSKRQNFGDLSTNAAMVVAQTLGKPPRLIADALAQTLSHALIDRIDIAGPGFLNIFLKPQAFIDTAYQLFEDHTNYFKLSPEEPKVRYNVEFVSANPTGPLHLGHGRNGIIGDVLSNVLRFLGHDVTKEFYINDAGAQIQKLGRSFKIRCQQELGETLTLPEDAYHGDYLVTLAQKVLREEPTAVQQALFDDNTDFFEQYAKNYLLEQLKITLTDYGITFDVWFSEKVLHVDGAVEAALKLLEEKNYAYINEDALWFKSTAFGDDKDRVLKRANGEVTYAAADVAYLQNKLARGAQKVIMVVGQDHHSYVQRMKGIMQALGHNAADIDVILYQLVTIKESGELVRMSKRAGNIVSLRDVIDTVGKDVARFFYLNRKADAHLELDIALALKHTDENPVYYIQYAYVRTNSILEKASENSAFKNISSADLGNFTEQEKLLLKKIMALQTLLKNIAATYQTHMLTYYVLELANAFHSYYAGHKVIDVNDVQTSRSRLALVIIVQKTFRLCMELLGIDCPEKM